MRPEDTFDRDLRAAMPASPSGTGCPDPEAWIDLERGDLGADESEALRRHLEGCPACARAAADALRFVEAVDDPAERRASPGLLRWSIAAAAAALVALAGWVGFRTWQGPGGSAVERLAATLEVPAPPVTAEGSVESELTFRGAETPAAIASRRDALVPYRERRYAAACDALGRHGERYPEDREARYLAAVACIESGDLDRADRMLASLAAVAGDRREAAKQLLDRLREARASDRR